MRIEADPDRCRLYLVQANERLELPPLWLRERSPDPEQCDPASHQRLFDPHQLPDDLAVTDPGFELRFKLDPGELMMFDNIRVLHGRTEFDPNEGPRQLQGCHIDREGLRSLYRVACRGG